MSLTIQPSFFKRSAYDEAGGYDTKCDGFEDWHLWSRMVTKDNALVLNVTTTYYRLSERHKRGMAFRARLARSRGLRLEECIGLNYGESIYNKGRRSYKHLWL